MVSLQTIAGLWQGTKMKYSLHRCVTIYYGHNKGGLVYWSIENIPTCYFKGWALLKWWWKVAYQEANYTTMVYMQMRALVVRGSHLTTTWMGTELKSTSIHVSRLLIYHNVVIAQPMQMVQPDGHMSFAQSQTIRFLWRSSYLVHELTFAVQNHMYYWKRKFDEECRCRVGGHVESPWLTHQPQNCGYHTGLS